MRNTQKEPLERVEQFRESLEKVVGLGYGEDECDPVVTVMFEQLVRSSVDGGDTKKLPFRVSAPGFSGETTHAELLQQATELKRFVERTALEAERQRRCDPILFPFLTALGISGGIFLLVVHVTRLAPIVLERAGLFS